MTMHAAPPTLLIPESAPFSPDQRAWLSGYFAALLSAGRSGATPLSPADAAGLPEVRPPVRCLPTPATRPGTIPRLY